MFEYFKLLNIILCFRLLLVLKKPSFFFSVLLGLSPLLDIISTEKDSVSLLFSFIVRGRRFRSRPPSSFTRPSLVLWVRPANHFLWHRTLTTSRIEYGFVVVILMDRFDGTTQSLLLNEKNGENVVPLDSCCFICFPTLSTRTLQSVRGDEKFLRPGSCLGLSGLVKYIKREGRLVESRRSGWVCQGSSSEWSSGPRPFKDRSWFGTWRWRETPKILLLVDYFTVINTKILLLRVL